MILFKNGFKIDYRICHGDDYHDDYEFEESTRSWIVINRN